MMDLDLGSRAVLSAVLAEAQDPAALAERTGLPPEAVRQALDKLGKALAGGRMPGRLRNIAPAALAASGEAMAGLPSCLRISSTLLPRVRAVAANLLYQQGWTQVRIARALGVSQPMVSQYRAKAKQETSALVFQLAREHVVAVTGTVKSIPKDWCKALSAADQHDHGIAALEDLVLCQMDLEQGDPASWLAAGTIELFRVSPEDRDAWFGYASPMRVVDGHLRSLQAPEPRGSLDLPHTLLALQAAHPDARAFARVVRQSARPRGGVSVDRDEEGRWFVGATAAEVAHQILCEARRSYLARRGAGRMRSRSGRHTALLPAEEGPAQDAAPASGNTMQQNSQAMLRGPSWSPSSAA